RGRNVDGRTDVYALGVMLFEMVCGKLPFDADNPMDLMRLHLTEPPPSARATRPGLPRELDRLIAGLLDKRAEGRPSLAEVRAAIAGMRRALAAPRPARRSVKPRVALSAALLAVLVSLGWWASGEPASRRARLAARFVPIGRSAKTDQTAVSTHSAPAPLEAREPDPPRPIDAPAAKAPGPPAADRASHHAHHSPRHLSKRVDRDYLVDPFGGRP